MKVKAVARDVYKVTEKRMHNGVECTFKTKRLGRVWIPATVMSGSEEEKCIAKCLGGDSLESISTSESRQDYSLVMGRRMEESELLKLLP